MKDLKNIGVGLLSLLLGTGTIGVFKLAFAVTRQTEQIAELQKSVDELKAAVSKVHDREVYFHGRETPGERDGR